jgi:hypothetical protein
MASRITAINSYRPRIKLGETVQKGELVRYLSDRTGLNEGEVSLVLAELRDTLIFFSRAGRGVKMEGLGSYLPSIDLAGTITIDHRLDPAIKEGLNAGRKFAGTIDNRQNIGKTSEELVALWNSEHPNDPVA